MTANLINTTFRLITEFIDALIPASRSFNQKLLINPISEQTMVSNRSINRRLAINRWGLSIRLLLGDRFNA